MRHHFEVPIFNAIQQCTEDASFVVGNLFMSSKAFSVRFANDEISLPNPLSTFQEVFIVHHCAFKTCELVDYRQLAVVDGRKVEPFSIPWLTMRLTLVYKLDNLSDTIPSRIPDRTPPPPTQKTF